MKLGLTTGYSGAHLSIDIQRIREAENLGYDSVWTAEAYGSDAVTTLAWIGAQTQHIKLGTAIMQFPARTPAMTAMTAMTLDALSGNRFLLGLGPSGPQVIEGWHGVAYGKPLARTREYVAILRRIFERTAPLEFKGSYYEIPYTGPGATGLGKPLKSILHGRADLPIYTAAVSPKGIALSAEVADGLLLVWADPERADLLTPVLAEGFAKAPGGKQRADFDVASFVTCVLGDDLEQCRQPMKHMLALYIGGMGARGKNFYFDYAARMGYEEETVRIQDLFLSGRKPEAAAAVPDSLVDAVALIGPKERIAERAVAWKYSPIDTLIVGGARGETLHLLAELFL